MTLFNFPTVVPAPSIDPGDISPPVDARVIARFNVNDEKLDLILTKRIDLLGEVQALGRKVEAIVAENAAAAGRAR